MKYRYHYKTAIGAICIEECDNAVVGLYREEKYDEKDDFETELLKEAGRQLTEYLNRQRKKFDLPLRVEGTEFQQKVWNTLQEIPYGATCTYGELAQKIGQPKAARAVGGANNKNPIMIFIPCHRVIGADGSLVGFGGGLDMKEYLLNLEK
ncbi:MAG: methylated-DNA--[protein]-cysteine S-methyltransferase [Clostridiales bacterium]|nr:methylated-DNA--[protein]-cysteine S-methyltransferase [Clostridiales bacterium]